MQKDWIHIESDYLMNDIGMSENETKTFIRNVKDLQKDC